MDLKWALNTKTPGQVPISAFHFYRPLVSRILFNKQLQVTPVLSGHMLLVTTHKYQLLFRGSKRKALINIPHSSYEHLMPVLWGMWASLKRSWRLLSSSHGQWSPLVVLPPSLSPASPNPVSPLLTASPGPYLSPALTCAASLCGLLFPNLLHGWVTLNHSGWLDVTCSGRPPYLKEVVPVIVFHSAL